MSGIAGIIGKREKRDKEKLNVLLDKISHRGDKREVLDIPEGIAGINTNYDFDTRVNGHTILMDGRIYNLENLL